MFFNKKKGSNSQFSKLGLSSVDSISRNVSESNEDISLPANAKKSKKKNLFNVLKYKISSVLEGKSKDSPRLCSSVKTLRSKSFEVLSNSFEEDSESQERVITSEDSVFDKNKWGSKRSQSIRSKQVVCPAEYTVNIQFSNASRTRIHQGNLGIDGTPNSSSSRESEIDCLPNKSINNIKYSSNLLTQHCESFCQNSLTNQNPNKEEQNFTLFKENSLDKTSEESSKKPVSTLPDVPKKKEIQSLTLKDLGLETSPYLGIVNGECRSLAKEISELSKHGWYWGPLNRNEAEEKLSDQPDGAFLVRDSSGVKYLLSLSFRSYGKTLHTRIEHSNGWYSFYPQPDHDSHRSLVGLINHCISESDEGVFCYSRPHIKGSPSFPVRLTKPVSRFMQVRSLQYLCRFVIRQYTSINHIQNLPLPPKIKGYLEERYY